MMSSSNEYNSGSSLRECPLCGHTRHRIRYQPDRWIMVQCRRCRFVYLGNPPTLEPAYEEYYAGEEALTIPYTPDSPHDDYRELYHINTQRVDLLTKIRDTGDLLDIGCGNGFFLDRAQSIKGYNPEGIDVSSGAVEFARNRFQVNARQASFREMIREEKRWDIITMWHVLEHFPDPVARLREIATLLNPNGICIVEVPNLHSLKFLLSRDKWEGGNHPRYYRSFFTARTLKRCFRQAGFRRIRRHPLSYRLPERSTLYEWSKQILNWLRLDAFILMSSSRPDLERDGLNNSDS